MKYIRTKDGIYKVENGFIQLKNQELFLEHFKDHILKQADTIEELCDGYVVEHPINVFKFFYDKKEMFDFLNNTCAYMFKFCELCIYSIIKTNKCLIYVAKLNDKGELELLWT